MADNTITKKKRGRPRKNPEQTVAESRKRKPGTKMGAPIKPFDWDLLDKILKLYPTLRDCSAIMNVSEDTVENRIKEKHGVTFSEYRSKMMAGVRLSLQKRAIEMAQAGNTAMNIFLLKTLCGWHEKKIVEHTSDNNVIQVKIDKDDKEL